MFITHWFQIFLYRLRQVRQQLGFVPPLTVSDYQEVARWLPASALPLFLTMSMPDQQHSLRVCRGLLSLGCEDDDLLAAALLHDVGKAQGRVPFWSRPVLVLGNAFAPHWLHSSIIDLEKLEDRNHAGWQRALSYAWWHAEVGANLAASAGLSEHATLYIRTHHQSHGPAALLHQVDEES
jgi:hypothetical protein